MERTKNKIKLESVSSLNDRKEKKTTNEPICGSKLNVISKVVIFTARVCGSRRRERMLPQ